MKDTTLKYINNENVLENYIKNYVEPKKKKQKGRKITEETDFIKICKKEKGELKNWLSNELKKYYKEVISKNGFLYARGDKITLTAHMDTTPSVEYGKRKMVKEVYARNDEKGKEYIYSPQGIGGDDRCGVYMIMEILKRTDLRPTIIFCEDEEIGCIGSTKFSMSKYIEELEDMYFIIELDRRGSNDIVFYDDENEEFHEYVAEVTGYIEQFGSCSDISQICPECKVSGVNLSCGYYNEHHNYEKVYLDEMENTLNTTIKLIKKGLEDKVHYEYKEKVYYRNSYADYCNNINRYGYSYDYGYGYGKSASVNYGNNTGTNCYLTVEFDNGYGDCGEDSYEGDSIADLWYQFFSSHPNVRMCNVTDYVEWTSDDFVKESEDEYTIENIKA